MTNIDQFNADVSDEALTEHAHRAAKSLECSSYTVMRLSIDQMSVKRTYSSDEAVFPLSDRKPTERSDWFVQVVEQKTVFAANNPDEMGGQFRDQSKMLAMGYPAVMNIPVQFRSEVVAIINLLAPENHFDSDRLKIAVDFTNL